MSSAEQPLNQQIHTLYSDHHGWLQNWLQRKLGNRCDAADLAQDTFVRLLTRQVARPLGSEPRALLTHIAKGLVIDRWRRQDLERAYLETIAHLPEAEVPSPETRVLILETLWRIEALLRELPSATREAFLLSQIEGLTYDQIARRLNVSLITVKRYMRAAFLACLSVA
ncbi:sigma-70 family RNA polymerase sigma factor [Pseudomonas vancouverensis]|uniref:Sigma-70 family RNA polymerase sigma factor n=1 Tax=Pseudomonas vancouverensis TaxID=95300 RepID=A0A1H2MK37_PSEVA|nr:sigma-70 family RNA polymerase sigma factor [Pseudomonas vancouverensis]KAB0494781.1 sigma-70 family RNA polymerase sigma factor [Pseudomonas vancouverensis]TDB63577.1 sigma-70 family RNA polymerase sigma factor [Pseudomonas vancouverensis]SDU93434.1 RNA polymerase sigma-70 factor, ECF subfamily [Pseudomonas vancouverensis]